jgi:tetratricopeptide (TPR) repeat protein
LIEFRVAKTVGKSDEATVLMDRLVRHGPEATPNANSEELEIAIEVEHCHFCIINGWFPDAATAFSRVESLSRRARHVSPEQQVNVSIMAALSSAHQRTNARYDSLERLNDTLELSLNFGSVRGVLSATIGLMHYWADVADDERASVYAERSIQLARRVEGAAGLVTVAVDVGAAMLATKHWRMLNPLLFEAEALALPGSRNWTAIRGLEGNLLRRLGHRSKALEVLVTAETAARDLKNDRLYGMVLREMALALHDAGRRDEARECIKTAVTLAESSASALGLRLAHMAASKILKNT